MFQSLTGLPHILPPAAYHEPRWFERECDGPLRQAWHLIGIDEQLSRPGDFITTTILGVPIQVRRFEDQLVAISNVCAHRHCLVSSLPHGRSETMRCQYHGWEYGADGYTRKIPCAKDFAPIDREAFQLDRYRVDRCGQLVFISLSDQGPTLSDYLGSLEPKMKAGFGEGMKCFFKWTIEYEANWKVAIENSLEAYHVQSIHPNTFRSDPGESRSEHILELKHTAFGTDLPFAATKIDMIMLRAQGWMLRLVGHSPTRRYWQHHVFPNLLSSFTDAISLAHCVEPISPTRSRSVFYQFGIHTAQRAWTQPLLSIWGKFEAWCTKQILKEDVELYPKIQLGLNASKHAGRLARSEERIHRFQEYWATVMKETAEQIAAKSCQRGTT